MDILHSSIDSTDHRLIFYIKKRLLPRKQVANSKICSINSQKFRIKRKKYHFGKVGKIFERLKRNANDQKIRCVYGLLGAARHRQNYLRAKTSSVS